MNNGEFKDVPSELNAALDLPEKVKGRRPKTRTKPHKPGPIRTSRT